MGLHAFQLVAVSFLLLFAAWHDIAARTIPNTVPALIAVVGLIDRALFGQVPLMQSVAASVVLFLLLLLAFSRGMLGGGDVKLMAAVACGLTPFQTYRFVFLTALFGGGLAAVHLVLRRVLKGLKPRKPPAAGTALPYRVMIAERWRIARRGPLPYALAIACGGIAALDWQILW